MQHKKVISEKFSVKKMIVLALLFMMIGTLLELYLLDHYEDAFQLIPVLCIAFSLINLIILFFKRSIIIIKLFKLVLVARRRSEPSMRQLWWTHRPSAF